MNWLWWIGGGLVALVVVVGAAYALGLGGLLRVVRAVLDALGDAAKSAREWLAVPGNKTRFVCAAFALLFLAAGLQSWQRGTVIVQQRADYTRLKDDTGKERAGWAEKVGERDRTILHFAQLAEQQRRALDLLAEQNAQALKDAAQAKRQALEAEAKFEQEFASRPPACEAALQAMAKACPTLKGY